MKHYMKLKPEPFEKISSGNKTIELRLLDEKRCLVKPGDEIEFTNLENTDETITVRVLKIHAFKSFEELYKALPLDKCGYSQEEIPNATATDIDKYYSKEEQAQYGAVGIEFESYFRRGRNCSNDICF